MEARVDHFVEKLDQDDDGCFDKSELKRLFTLLSEETGSNIEISDDLIDRVMKDYDISRNVKLEREELTPLVQRIMLRVVYEMSKKLKEA